MNLHDQLQYKQEKRRRIQLRLLTRFTYKIGGKGNEHIIMKNVGSRKLSSNIRPLIYYLIYKTFEKIAFPLSLSRT